MAEYPALIGQMPSGQITRAIIRLGQRRRRQDPGRQASSRLRGNRWMIRMAGETILDGNNIGLVIALMIGMMSGLLVGLMIRMNIGIMCRSQQKHGKVGHLEIGGTIALQLKNSHPSQPSNPIRSSHTSHHQGNRHDRHSRPSHPSNPSRPGSLQIRRHHLKTRLYGQTLGRPWV